MNFKENQSAEKLRGGYYTPIDLAAFLCEWVAEKKPQTVLEPSCGDGIFLDALAARLPSGPTVTAIELNEPEARKAAQRANAHSSLSINVVCADFLDWYLKRARSKEQFDSIVGNPPFIRYQYLSKSDQDFSAEIFRRHSLPFTKHTNAWVPFVIASLSLLRPGGRLAMVLPAEILHVLHAQSLRHFVGQQCSRAVIFDPEELWFDGTLQGAVLFLAEKKMHVNEHTAGLGIIRTSGKQFLTVSPTEHFANANYINGKTVEGKWTRALLTPRELSLFEGLAVDAHVHRFADVADVDVGVVTGANKFFLVDDETVERHGLVQWSYPMFGRSEHCPGVLYDKKQHKRNAKAGLPSNFLWFDIPDSRELPEDVLDYIVMGESENLHTRYKCRIRKPWFKVPSVYSTPVGMLKRAHDMPRLIYNELQAYTTDTAYRIRTRSVDAKKLVYCFLNSFTALSSEIEGRHYGGGVLELVPSEIERLLVPIPLCTRPAIKSLDKVVRSMSASEILMLQDRKVLTDLGLSNGDVLTMHNAWDRLRKRRQRRASALVNDEDKIADALSVEP